MATKLIFCNVPSNNPQGALQFYGTLLGGGPDEFAQAPHDQIVLYQQLISPDGIDLKVTQRNHPSETVTCFFGVDDLDGTLSQLQAVGGTVVVPPAHAQVAQAAMPELHAQRQRQGGGGGQTSSGDMGRWALVRDPDGNLVGLVELTATEARQHYKMVNRASFSQEQRDAKDKVKQLHQHMRRP